MGTRCNLHITEQGFSCNESFQLYRHLDGYPTSILSSLLKAFKISGGGWQAGRAGKVAGCICAAGYDQYEPESNLQLHSDIEWFYRLTCINKAGGSLAEKPIWQVKIYRPKKSFWDNPIKKNMVRVAEGDLIDLAKRADEIEKRVYDDK
jgi:hypothetical protein